MPGRACFLDESIDTPEVAEILRNAEVNVVRFADRFPRGVDDEAWLLEARDREWLIFGRDKRWRRHRSELDALIRVKARAFIVVSQGSALEVADLLLRLMPRIAEIEFEKPPYIYKISQYEIVKIDLSSMRFPSR